MHKYIRLVLILTILGVWLGFPLGQVAAEAGILLTKTASADNATLGDNITYTYTIVNNTSDNLTGLTLEDNKIGEIDIPDQLPAGGNITATAWYIVSQSDYANNATQLVNIATLNIISSNSVLRNPRKSQVASRKSNHFLLLPLTPYPSRLPPHGLLAH